MHLPRVLARIYLRCVQDGYITAVALFGDWAERSGLDPLVEMVSSSSGFRGRDVVPVRESSGASGVRMPTPELIMSYLLEVSMGSLCTRGHATRAHTRECSELTKGHVCVRVRGRWSLARGSG